MGFCEEQKKSERTPHIPEICMTIICYALLKAWAPPPPPTHQQFFIFYFWGGGGGGGGCELVLAGSEDLQLIPAGREDVVVVFCWSPQKVHPAPASSKTKTNPGSVPDKFKATQKPFSNSYQW